MSVTRVNIIENNLKPAEFLKMLNQMAVPEFKKAKKDGLKNWSIVQTDDKTIIITNWVNKTKANKFANYMRPKVAGARTETGSQSWIYMGQVKAGG